MTQQYLTLRVGANWYGIPLTTVSEVLHMVALTELPAAPPDVLGLLILRNALLPVLDLRRRFQLDAPPLQLNTPIIAIHAPETQQMLGLVVDEVDAVVSIPTTEFSATQSPYVLGAVQLANELLLILDVAALATTISVHIDPTTLL